jgi:hypothetical protein
MPFSKCATFDPETLALLTRVFNTAWHQEQAAGQSASDTKIARELLAARIMQAARDGERDPQALLAAAMGRSKS